MLSDISIRNPIFAWMLMIGLTLFGFLSFLRLGISQMPDVDFPVINIRVTWNGASPEVIETNAVDIMEDAIMSVDGIREINSTSKYGSANITVELDLSKNVDTALQEVQSRIAQAQKLLPTTIDPPIITKYNPEDQPILWLGISSKSELRDLMVFVKDHVKNKFSTINGVGQIVLGGYVDRNLRIWIDGNRMSSRELTVDDILNTIAREHTEVPAGLIETQTTNYSIRSMGEVTSVEKFSNLPITMRGGSPIFESNLKIRDIALVEDGLDDVQRISRFNQNISVGIGIVKQRGVNAVEVAKNVKLKIEELNKELPEGYRIDIVFDSTKFIEESIEELEFTIILSAILTGIVTYLFLGSFSSTFNILLAIPTSIMGSFLILYYFGFTLNTFTLLGLSLAMGIVVDDAIMVLENIARHKEMGKTTVQAAIDGAREISFAATATTLSIIAIFLPVAFMDGIIGKYFYQFAITITAAVLLSLLEALTLTPMRCSQFLDIGHNSGFGKVLDKFFNLISDLYKILLKWVLKFRWTVLLLSLAAFGASFLLLKPLKKEFVPSQDQSQIMIRLKTPVGSSIYFTDELTKKCEEYLSLKEEITKMYVAVGGFGGGESDSAIILLTLKPPHERPIFQKTGKPISQNEFAGELRKELGKISKDLKIIVRDMSMRGFSSSRGFPVELTIKGRDWDKLALLSESIMKKMEESGNFLDIDSNFKKGQPEIQVFPNRRSAASHGVSITSIGNVISAMIGGVKSGQFTDGGHRYDIRVRLATDERLGPNSINNLFVRNNRGELVRLRDVVDLKEEPTLQSITRNNRERAITIFANPAPDSSQKEAIDLAVNMAKDVLPDGYYLSPSGSGKTLDESFSGLGMALVLGIIIAYMILASQFESLIHPITVLMAMPFSFSGAILALYLFDRSLNIYSFIALILLMGLVKKNSILLVDFTNQMIVNKPNAIETLMESCPIRLRPILMTSVSTIAAALPPALSIGPGGESRSPMAIAIIGGMIVSTILTLILVPIVYSLFYDLSQYLKKPKQNSMNQNDLENSRENKIS
ncbi:MAG: efflux RND transporter permease subunit [Leptospiraceae bacterium]|nr:efflux RND transporter permease subunit [Leptospiraceae bacterium]MCP5510339.1 efflux RND transporter permease subunit [Leptospiraceae bacterium]